MATFDMLRNDSETVTFSRGDVIFAAGDSGDYAFVVTEGEVDLSIHERYIESVVSGLIFGELALIDHKTRSATATAWTKMKIVPVDQRRFLYLVQNTPFSQSKSCA